MVASLSLSGVSVTRAARPVLTDVDLLVAPGKRIGVVGPNGVGKSTLLAGRGRRPRARVGHRRARPAHRHRRLAAPGARAIRRAGARPARPPHRCHRRPARARRRHRRPRHRPPGRRRPLRRRAPPLARARRRRPRRPHRRGVRRARHDHPPARPAHRHAVGRRGGPRQPGRAAAVAVRRVPARRAHERPRPRRSRAAGAVGARARRRRAARQPRPPVPRHRRHRHRRDRRVQPPGQPLRRRLAGVPARARGRPPAGLGAVRGVRRQAQVARRPARRPSANGRSRASRR